MEEFTKARGYSKPNLRFRLRVHIEYLDRAGIADKSVDLIISNCVVNLSPDKERVLKEAYRVLAPGGELYFSDVYSSRRISEAARKDEVSSAGCCLYPHSPPLRVFQHADLGASNAKFKPFGQCMLQKKGKPLCAW